MFDIEIEESDYTKLYEKSTDPLKHCKCVNHSSYRDYRIIRFRGRLITVAFDQRSDSLYTVVYPRPKDKGVYKRAEKVWKKLSR